MRLEQPTTRRPTAERAGVLGIALLLALLVGCSYVLEISLVDPAAATPTFRLRKPAFFFLGPTTPKVRQVSVHEKTAGETDPLWGIESVAGVALRQVTYGVLPPGFEEYAPARELEPAHAYVVVVDAWGGWGSLELERKD